MLDMDLVVIFLWTHLETPGDGEDGEYIDEGQFPEISFEADDKRHYQEVGEIEQVFSRPESFHIIHDHQIKVQVDDGQDTGQLEFPSLVKMEGKNKKISGAQVYEGADIEAIGKIRYDADEIGDEREQNKLIEADHLPLSAGRILFPQTRINDVFIKRPGGQDQVVAQRILMNFNRNVQIMNGII